MINTQKKSVRIIILTGLELLILCLGIFLAYRGIHSLTSTNITIQDLTCNIAVYHDGAFAVEGNALNSGEETVFLYGPSIPLKKGSYVANIQYKTEKDQYVLANGTNAKAHLLYPAEFVKATKGILSRNSNTIAYRFEIPEDVAEFNLLFYYSGTGDFQVNSLSVSPTATYYKRSIANLIFALLIIDLIIFLSGTSKETKENVLLVIGIAFAVSIPAFFNHVGYNSGDQDFHFLRTEAVKQAILDRQFPSRISSIWLYGYGFPTSIYYNDILLIFPAILRILGYDILFCYKAYITGINLLSSFIALWAFRRMFSKKIGTITAITYMFAPYRLIDIFRRNALGEFSALTFLPLIAYGILNMYRFDGENWKEYHKYGIIMALGITGVVASHVLSLLIIVFFMLIIFLVFIRRSFRRNTLRLWFDTAFLSLALSAYFLVPFIDYYFNVDTLVKQNATVRGSGMIQYDGISLGRLLAFFPTSSSFSIRETIMPLTPGLVLSLALAGSCWYYYRTRKHKYPVYIGLSLFSLWLCTDFFPWNFMEAHTIIGQILAQVQFPFRFLMISDIVLCVLLGELLADLGRDYPDRKNLLSESALLLNAVYLIVFVSTYSSGMLYEKKYEYESLDNANTGLLYLPIDAPTDSNEYNTDFITENVEMVTLLSRTTHTMKIHALSKNGGSIEVPVLNYKGYRVFDTAGTEYEIYKGTKGRIGFTIPANFDSDLRIEFVAPRYWHAGICLSLISCLILGISIFLKRRASRHAV